MLGLGLGLAHLLLAGNMWHGGICAPPSALYSLIRAHQLLRGGRPCQRKVGRNVGAAVPLFVGGELGPRLTQCRGIKWHPNPSNRLATIQKRRRQDRQRSDSVGRIVLQPVAQKLLLPTFFISSDGRIVVQSRCDLLARTFHCVVRVFCVRTTAVIGCPELTAMDDMRLSRLGDGDIELACRSTEQKWRLTCVDNHWHGIVGNCTARQ